MLEDHLVQEKLPCNLQYQTCVALLWIINVNAKTTHSVITFSIIYMTSCQQNLLVSHGQVIHQGSLINVLARSVNKS